MLRILAVSFLCLLPLIGAAHEYRNKELVVGHPWARPTPGQAANGAAYLTITNGGTADDRLTGAKAAVSKAVELHAHILNADIVRMRKLEDGVKVPAGATVKFEPGGLHVMLLGLSAPLKEGESFPLTLIFEKAGEIDVEVKVEKRAEAEPSASHHNH